MPTFRSEMDRALGAQPGRTRQDAAPTRPTSGCKYEPGHPAADANGNVKYPNVNPLIEMTDMREAQRSYEANVNVIGATRRMIQRTHRHSESLRVTDRMARPITAANAYANIARLPTPRTPLPAMPARRSAGRQARTSFGSMLKDAIGSVERGRPQVGRADAAHGAGKANMVDVVTAVAETEVAIEAVVAVRDKVIAAYEEIMKMPI